MNRPKKNQLSRDQKRSVLLGLDRELAAQVRNTARQLDELSQRTGLDRDVITAVLLEDFEAVQSARLDPNRVTREQLRQIPGLTPALVEEVVSGRPYYSLDELQAVTLVPQRILETLFALPNLMFRDPFTDEEVAFMPVAGRYIIPQEEFEDADPVADAGYVDILVPDVPTLGLRVVAASSFEETHLSHHLKAALNGRVYPVLRDAHGFEKYIIPGSLDLWFRDEVPETERQRVIASLGLAVIQAVGQVGYYRVRLVDPPEDGNLVAATFAVIRQAQQLDSVYLAEPDQFSVDDFTPDRAQEAPDVEFEEAGQYWNHDLIELESAHTLTRGSPDVTIFVIDSGCLVDHAELRPAFRPDWQRLDLNFDLDVPAAEITPSETVQAHGTRVAGVIAGQGSVLAGQIAGIAPDCRILPVKISGQPVTTAYGLRAAAILVALDYLRPGERGVINISWRTNGEHIGIREALVAAQQRGVAIASSAGNYAPGASQTANAVHFPSAHAYLPPQLDALCAVGAVGAGDRKASYSYFGSLSLTVAAPGGEPGGAGASIFTTSTPENHVYTYGTSYATPHVAGLLALMFSLDKDLTPQDAIQILEETADDIDAVNPIYPMGAGRINAYRALQRIQASLPDGGTPPDDTVLTHIISATASSGGGINPLGNVAIVAGTDQMFEIIPEVGATISDVLVDGLSVGPVSTYTFENVIASHEIEAQFAATPQPDRPSDQDRQNLNQATAEELAALELLGMWTATSWGGLASLHLQSLN
jgi:subtilisin family serine protease